MYPLFNNKMPLYLFTAHGVVTSKNDQTKGNTVEIPKNFHIFGQGHRRVMSFSRGPDFEGVSFYDQAFNTIRYLWKKSKSLEYSFNDLFSSILPSLRINSVDETKKDAYGSWLTIPGFTDVAYFPPGCIMRNLQFSRDKRNIEVEGIFRIGNSTPLTVLSFDQSKDVGRLSTDYSYKNKLPHDVDPKIPKLKRNDLSECIQFIKKLHPNNEQIMILILACAVEEGYVSNVKYPKPDFSTWEGTIQPEHFHNKIYSSLADNSKITKIFLENKGTNLYKNNIHYILENNILYNETLHHNIHLPINSLNPKHYKFRSYEAFNSLLRHIVPNPTNITSSHNEYVKTHIHINGNITNPITFNEYSNLIIQNKPFNAVRIPLNYKRYLYTPSTQTIEFFNPYPNTIVNSNVEIVPGVRQIDIAPDRYNGQITKINFPSLLSNQFNLMELAYYTNEYNKTFEPNIVPLISNLKANIITLL